MKIDVWNPVMPSSDRPVGYRPKCGGDRWWSSCTNKELCRCWCFFAHFRTDSCDALVLLSYIILIQLCIYIYISHHPYVGELVIPHFCWFTTTCSQNNIILSKRENYWKTKRSPGGVFGSFCRGGAAIIYRCLTIQVFDYNDWYNYIYIYYIILYYIKLYYIVLYYIILYYIICTYIYNMHIMYVHDYIIHQEEKWRMFWTMGNPWKSVARTAGSIEAALVFIHSVILVTHDMGNPAFPWEDILCTVFFFGVL